MVRRIPDLNPQSRPGQETLFDTWRFHAFFTTTDPWPTPWPRTRPTAVTRSSSRSTPTSKHSALAHLPSGKFTANAAWLVLAVMAFNLTRAAATISGPRLAKATTATIRRKLIAVPARVASSARRLTLHLPTDWPWETAWSRPVHPRLRTTTGTDDLTTPPNTGTTTNPERPGSEARQTATPHTPEYPSSATATQSALLIGGSRLSPS